MKKRVPTNACCVDRRGHRLYHTIGELCPCDPWFGISNRAQGETGVQGMGIIKKKGK